MVKFFEEIMTTTQCVLVIQKLYVYVILTYWEYLQ